MKYLKRVFTCLLAVLLLAGSFPAVDITSFAAAKDEPDLILGEDGQITRAQWIHNLTVVFNMAVTEESMPDNYYSDLSEEHEYYYEIISAVEFGVINIAAGEALCPDEAATRDFAVSTLNFCLGYQMAEGAEYTFSDYESCSDPVSAQIALDREWVEAVDGTFSPETLLNDDEAEKMLDDAIAVLEATTIDEDHENTVEFKEDVIELGEETAVSVDENDVVTITDCPETISEGDKFAVYLNGIPVVYTATGVTVNGSDTVIETQTVENEEAFEDIDIQGVASVEDMEIIPADGVEITLEDDTSSSASTFAIKKLKAIKTKKITVTLAPGFTASLSFKLSNPYIEYYVKSDRAYAALNGDLKVTYDVTADMLDMAFITKSVNLFTVNIGGIGEIAISANLGFSGKAYGEVSGTLCSGIESVKDEGIRTIRQFEQKTYTANVEGSASVSVKATVGITKLPVISAYVYAEVGAIANIKATASSESSMKCVHYAAYLFAKYGATASVKFNVGFASYNDSISVNYDIYNESNSPVKIVHHYEDGKEVPECTRGQTYENFFTKITSRWGGCGWTGASGAYGLDALGVSVPVYEYTLNENNEATITKYNYNSWSVIIPSEIDGYKVVGIANDVFEYKDVAYVSIPDTVTSIGSYAFRGCSYLYSCKLPENLETIESYTFYECTSLSDIELPSSLTTLNGNAFGYCISLTEINIPKVLANIEPAGYDFYGQYYGPFNECSGLKTITFEDGITSIPYCLFASCNGIENITLPDTVTSIESLAFYECTALEEIKLSNSLTEIGGSAFCYCESLSSVELPTSLTTLDGNAFGYCTSLTEINIPKALANIEPDGYDFYGQYYGPFNECSGLKTITFEDGITSIPYCLFASCNGIENITLPDTVTIIESRAFYECTALKEIKLSNSPTKIESSAFCYCESLPSVELPTSLTTLNGNAFGYCTSLTEINIPKALKNIDPDGYDYSGHYYGPFNGCAGLKTITFEDGITSIPFCLFSRCNGIENITLPDTVNTIEERAFYSAVNLETVNIPDGVSVLETSTFSGCSSLKSIDIPSSVTAIENSVFSSCSFLTHIEIPDSVTSIGDYLLSGCTSLESVKLSENVDEIAYQMFYGCTALKSVTVPDSVELISTSAFYGCTGLESITFSENSQLENIYNYAFYGCTSLKEVILPESTKDIDSYVFENCTALEKVYIPQSVKDMGSDVFMGCEKLSDVTIADYSVTKINSNTFKDCPALQNIVLPKGLVSIGSQAFMNDTGLVGVTIPESVTSIDSTAFSYPDKTTVYGRMGSYAETFASEYGFRFSDNAIPAEGIILADGSEYIVLDYGDTYRAEFEFYPEDSNDVVTLTSDNSGVSIQGHDIKASRSSGDSVITATTTSGVSYEFTVHMRNAKNIGIVTLPEKTDYILGDEADFTGLAVQVVYNDGSVRAIEDYTVTGFDSSVEGECTVTVQWYAVSGNKYTTTFTVNIVDPRPKLTGIYIASQPDKVNFELREALDLTGLVVNATYTDGSEAQVTDYTVSGYNALKKGTQTLTVKYGDYTAEFTVTVGPVVTLTGIEIAQTPDRTEYDAEELEEDGFDFTGLVVNAVYSDGTTAQITDYTVDEFEFVGFGKNTVSISYNGFTAEYTVNITEPEFLKYEIVDDYAVITGYSTLSSETDIVIPSAIDGYPVRAINECAFEGAAIESVVIPDSVTYIDDEAFSCCEALKSVEMGANVTYIGNGAFAGTGIESIVIPDGVSEIMAHTFVSCVNLKEVTFGSKTTAIHEYAFSCTALESLTIPETVNYIGEMAFCGCANLKNVYIPDSVTTVEVFAFGFDEECNVYSDFTITGVAGSEAQEYADRYSITFIAIKQECNHPEIGVMNVVEATCTKDGYTGDSYCKSCGETLGAGSVIAATGHDYVAVVTDPTCTAKGYTTYTCNCGDSYVNDYTDMIPHKTVVLKGRDETCYQTGLSDGEMCTVCGTVTVEQKEVPTICHICNRVVVPSTCKTAGESYDLCIMCGMVENYKTLELAPHSYGSWVTAKEATCTSAGMIKRTCTVCGESETQTVAATGHSIVTVKGTAATCASAGLTDGEKCSVCGTVTKAQTVIPKTAHSLEHVRIDSTCTVAGVEYDICIGCDETFNYTTLALASHVFGEWTVTSEATYMSEGTMERHCANCNETETEIIPKLEAVNEAVDSESDISIKYDNSIYSGDIQINAVEEFDGESYQLLNKEKGNFRNTVYDITTTLDGEKVQPQGYVLVGIPLPDGYDPDKTVVYYVANDGSGLVKMNSYCENGFIWFETNHFSSYAIVDESEELPAYTLGDVNADGKINASDARLALRISAKLDTASETQFLAADVTKDNKITAADARKILRVSAKLDTLE